MCQLTIVSTKNPRWTKILLNYQLLTNSRNTNKDGYGVMAMNERMYFFKSGLEPQKDITRLLENLTHENFKAETLIGHVRLASTTNGRKLFGLEKSHPFVNDKLVLFHNGTLNLKKGVIPDGLTDSEYFHLMVSGRMSKPEDLLESVIAEYKENWEGKFAFIIPDIYSHNLYLARGFTAGLFQAEIKLGEKVIGTIINTEQFSLTENLEFCKILFYSTLNIKTLNWTIKEIERDSYFRLNQEDFSLEKLGEFKEETKKWEAASTVVKPIVSVTESMNRKPTYFSTVFKTEQEKAAVKRIKDFCKNWGFTATDVNFLIKVGLEIDSENVSPTDIKTFADFIVPILEKKILTCSRKVRALWRKTSDIIKIMGLSQVDFLYDNGLKYPFFLNSRFELQNLYNNINCISTELELQPTDDTDEEELESDLEEIQAKILSGELDPEDPASMQRFYNSNRYLGVEEGYD